MSQPTIPAANQAQGSTRVRFRSFVDLMPGREGDHSHRSHISQSEWGEKEEKKKQAENITMTTQDHFKTRTNASPWPVLYSFSFSQALHSTECTHMMTNSVGNLEKIHQSTLSDQCILTETLTSKLSVD